MPMILDAAGVTLAARPESHAFRRTPEYGALVQRLATVFQRQPTPITHQTLLTHWGLDGRWHCPGNRQDTLLGLHPVVGHEIGMFAINTMRQAIARHAAPVAAPRARTNAAAASTSLPSNAPAANATTVSTSSAAPPASSTVTPTPACSNASPVPAVATPSAATPSSTGTATLNSTTPASDDSHPISATIAATAAATPIFTSPATPPASNISTATPPRVITSPTSAAAATPPASSLASQQLSPLPLADPDSNGEEPELHHATILNADIPGDSADAMQQFFSQSHPTAGGVPQMRMKRNDNQPVSQLQIEAAEALAFPRHFPCGTSHLRTDRSNTGAAAVTVGEYAKQRILNEDPRFREDELYCAWLLGLWNFQQLSSAVQVQAKSNKTGQTAQQMLAGARPAAGEAFDDDVHLWPVTQNIRGTPQYWAHNAKDLHAMVRTLGPATWFLTLSANDLGWDDLALALGCPDAEPEAQAAFLEQLTPAKRRSLLQNNQVGPGHTYAQLCVPLVQSDRVPQRSAVLAITVRGNLADCNCQAFRSPVACISEIFEGSGKSDRRCSGPLLARGVPVSGVAAYSHDALG